MGLGISKGINDSVWNYVNGNHENDKRESCALYTPLGCNRLSGEGHREADNTFTSAAIASVVPSKEFVLVAAACVGLYMAVDWLEDAVTARASQKPDSVEDRQME